MEHLSYNWNYGVLRVNTISFISPSKALHYLENAQEQRIRTEKDAMERTSTDIAVQVCVSR